MLTIGTITSPANMATAPQLIGDCKITGKDSLKKIFAIIKIELKKKHAQQDAFVTLFEYKAYMNGARNAPANAPQDTPINWAIKVTALLY